MGSLPEWHITLPHWSHLKTVLHNTLFSPACAASPLRDSRRGRMHLTVKCCTVQNSKTLGESKNLTLLGTKPRRKGRAGRCENQSCTAELATNQIPNSLSLTWVFHSKALPWFQTVTQYLKASSVVPWIPGESQARAGDWSKGLWGLHSTPLEGRCWGVSKRVFKGRERSFLKSLCTFPSLPLLLPKHAPVQWVTDGCHRVGIPAVLFSAQENSPSSQHKHEKLDPETGYVKEHRTNLAILWAQQTTDKILASSIQRRVFLKTGAGRKGESVAHF